MNSSSPEEIKHHVKIYISVFVALAALTLITVAVSYWHLPLVWAVIVALSIASVKASLVACFFMHLLSEKKVIIYTLILTVVFFIFLLALPALNSLLTFRCNHVT